MPGHAGRSPMKKAFLCLVLTAVLPTACAPRAVVLGMPTTENKDKPRNGSRRTHEPAPAITKPRGDNLGLLDGREVSNLPDGQDMKPSNAGNDSGPVIANPPKEGSNE